MERLSCIRVPSPFKTKNEIDTPSRFYDLTAGMSALGYYIFGSMKVKDSLYFQQVEDH